MNERQGAMLKQSFALAIRIINLYKFLVSEKKEFVLSKQILRSGTSVGAMIRESRNAESDRDFIHKLGIAQKECDETIYWLELLKETDYINGRLFDSIVSDAEGVLRMLKSAILTTKRRLASPGDK